MECSVRSQRQDQRFGLQKLNIYFEDEVQDSGFTEGELRREIEASRAQNARQMFAQEKEENRGK